MQRGAAALHNGKVRARPLCRCARPFRSRAKGSFRPSGDDALTETDERPERKRRLFEDVSAVQVVATAAAAVTSMLLSSYIGIAGSIIGVAVASVVSTLAASLYKKFLADSAEKIKELPVVANPSSALAHVLPGHRECQAEDGRIKACDEAEPAADERASSQPTEALVAGAGGSTLVAADGGATRGSALSTEETQSLDHEAVRAGSPAAGAEPNPAAALHRQRKLVRGLIVVCIVSALLAVAASGAVVYFATMGAGLGQKPAPIYLSAPFTPIEDDDDATNTVPSSASSASGSADSNTSEPSDSSDGNTTPGDGDGNTGDGGDSGGGSDPGTGPGSSENPDPSNPGDGSGSGDAAPGGSTGGAGGSDKPSSGTKPIA